MKITAVHLYGIHLPLKEPFIVSYETYTSIPSVIVKIETDNGLSGYGEAVADEHVTGETWASTYQVLKNTLIPAVIGENPFHLEKIHDKMNQVIHHAPTAKAAVDIACYDLIGKALKQPVYQLLGGKYHEQFPVAHVVSILEPEEMAADALRAVQQGYKVLKLKVGTDKRKDIERIRAVREKVGNEIVIRVDVNQGWTTSADSLFVLNKIEDCEIDWIEQPVLADDLDALVEVKQKSRLPVMADEALHSKKEMREIIAKRAADKVNIKLMKCGGIYPAMKLVHQAEMAGITCQVGSMVESSIASAAGFHLSFSKKNITSVELTGPLKFTKDVGNLTYDLPYIQLNDLPGLGVEVDEDVLFELTDMHDVIKGDC
ncbi:mandelate racemase/muconate lactonizing enzyme family protein [Halalkalibacter krulwichiae]|uniref:Dipeptide epimerase n=1 Tax=Halalkalibacter krulwichiae TaxID=199441 RepID=A0A1X9MFQ4_9BACI|nr:dipeptide epimerase [Halalkalibacter krulwichiae]ARK32279.1 L-Ala-D/L-Glu epimerase [Halalkalibacter krulwichiae]